MDQKPVIQTFEDGTIMWEHKFNLFTAKVYVPHTDLMEDIINFGYEAPYMLYFEEKPLSFEEAKQTADGNGMAKVASQKATSVVFISPNNEGGFAKAPEGLFEEVIENSKIHEYHEKGYAILVNRFSHETDGYAIRGAIFRSFVYGHGEAADYIAKNLCKTINGAGLWGPAVVTPTGVILDSLSVKPDIQRRDMPIASVHNSDDMNAYISDKTDHFYASETMDWAKIYESFLRGFIRWGWVGDLTNNKSFEEMNVVEEFAEATVKTSADNAGDDAGTVTHRIGYIAYYNKGLFEKGPAPLLLCFHGGGDSAMHIAQVSQWYRVAKDHDFLLICIENHLNSTATEMIELIEILKAKYDIDASRIYGSGFSMGGCKSWDLYQEYPNVFAGLAPMDATFDVGLNVFGQPSPKEINENVLVPIFYVGGEETPLPELPFQAQKCTDRMAYVFKVNNLKTAYDVSYEDQSTWSNKIWGINGDSTAVVHDDERDSDMTIHYFESQDGEVYTAFASVSGMGHECRYHSCENAWKFISQFMRNAEGKIVR